MLNLNTLTTTGVISPISMLLPKSSESTESFENMSKNDQFVFITSFLIFFIIIFGMFFYSLYLSIKCNKGIFAVLAFIFAFIFPWFYLFIALVFQRCY